MAGGRRSRGIGAPQDESARGQVPWEQIAAMFRSQNRTSPFEMVARHHPTPFDGRTDPTVLEEWVYQFEKLYRVIPCSEEEKVAIAAHYLVGNAGRWWESVRAECMSNDGFGWESFLKTLRGRFYPAHVRRAKLEEFMCLSQERMSVEEYFAKFVELAYFAPELVATEEARVSKFRTGLHPAVRRALAPFTSEITTLQGLYERAASVYQASQENPSHVEQTWERGESSHGRELDQDRWIQDSREDQAYQGEFSDVQATPPFVPQQQRFPQQQSPQQYFLQRQLRRQQNQHPQLPTQQFQQQRGNEQRTPPVRACRRCDRVHPTTDCQGNPIICFTCGQPGHRASRCPSSGRGRRAQQGQRNN